ncbi:uncharacterized protein AMSG_12354 [Thecamonas trahens ATCC 50062]|uniref:Kinesin-like protein n=1 Tax=Thecamonas trahens ATCC 50062 TaxID=461836 RepID=A0A0L0DQA6_THETB|nr:hypothetical protein AMSG_12354 [Thecamonas trahens ATCC 50062]KNC54455.1 hypothetical protein AMSG_12354 [Thecamonas trahens ATCC 50062]|eukprot:XP_013753667.1 hypothetical protein AMSG_12354 [Thecamonas trahens ATCC 50062]
MSSSGAKITVALRMRPFSSREADEGAEQVVHMTGAPSVNSPQHTTCTLTDPDSGDIRKYVFDACFDSTNPAGSHNAGQQDVYVVLGAPLVLAALSGVNGCLFAYGQTGAGKTYSMMGVESAPGVVPLLLDALFAALDRNANPVVVASYLEIYNEELMDLLQPRSGGPLAVREHPARGVFVQGLARVGVTSAADAGRLLSEGSKMRSVAATAMNASSSRSHAVFMLDVSVDHPASGQRVNAKLNLVDLAGSERQAKTGTTGARFKEAVAINSSLSALGNVISALSKAAAKGSKPKHVAYRNSVLTRLLQQSLGGNSRTAMLAAVSPAHTNFEETLSTMRFAKRVRAISTKPVVNAVDTGATVAELQAEIARLKALLAGGGGDGGGGNDDSGGGDDDAAAQLAAAESIIAELTADVATREAQAAALAAERKAVLDDAGISVVELGQLSGAGNASMLVNMAADAADSANLVWVLDPARGPEFTLGHAHGCSLVVHGPAMQAAHARLVVSGEGVTLEPLHASARTFVNGLAVPPNEPRVLEHGARIFLGTNTLLRFVDGEAGPASLPPLDWKVALEEVAMASGLAVPRASAGSKCPPLTAVGKVALVVELHAVRGLPKADVVSRSADPYAVLTLEPGGLRSQTETLVRTRDPEFNHSVCWPGPFVDGETVLRVVVWDADKLSTDDYLGEVELVTAIALGELTIPPFIIRWMLRHAHLGHSLFKLYVANDIVFFLSFFINRICLGLPFTLYIIASPDGDVVIKSCAAIIAIISLLWFSIITSRTGRNISSYLVDGYWDVGRSPDSPHPSSPLPLPPNPIVRPSSSLASSADSPSSGCSSSAPSPSSTASLLSRRFRT